MLTGCRYVYPMDAVYTPPVGEFLQSIDNDPLWIAEPKKDGWRTVVIRNESVELWNRHGSQFPYPLIAIKQMMEFLPKGTVLDAEMINFRKSAYKDTLYIFDVLMWAGEDMTELAFCARRALLQTFVKPSRYIWLPEHRILKKLEFYQQCVANGDDGIVLKRVDKPYVASLTGQECRPWWMKVKPNKNYIATGSTMFGCLVGD